MPKVKRVSTKQRKSLVYNKEKRNKKDSLPTVLKGSYQIEEILDEIDCSTSFGQVCVVSFFLLYF